MRIKLLLCLALFSIITVCGCRAGADTETAATTTPVASFKAQMAYLKEGGFTVVPLPQFLKR